MIDWWPLLLPAAALSGWWGAHRQQSIKNNEPSEAPWTREYVVGLNYLLNEQSDKAVDLFIKLLEVDSDTVETHLALGSLFRRRGEVDRAIRIHQNLIARPQLSALQRKEALIALGQDYMSAGVFDRAERIFLEVIELVDKREVNSLRGLLAIYQQEKEWEKALLILHQLEVASNVRMNAQAAHYHCEIALKALKALDVDKAHQMIKKALGIDEDSVRASLMLADFEMRQGNHRQAIHALKKIHTKDPHFITEIIEPLVSCHKELDAMDECIDYLEQVLQEHPRASILFQIGDYLRQ